MALVGDLHAIFGSFGVKCWVSMRRFARLCGVHTDGVGRIGCERCFLRAYALGKGGIVYRDRPYANIHHSLDLRTIDAL